MSHYDVIVIGSGAGGGTLAHRLAPSGKQVLLLERGDWLPREPQNWSAADVFVDNRYVSPDTWYDAHGKSFQPQIHYFVGGATKLYGAALYRLRAEDFGELAHADGLSPAWPVGYDEFEPYYTQAEQLYQVHGARGEDPTEPPASAPYPFPPVSHEPRMQQLSDDLAAAGLHPFHAPCGVLLDEQNPLDSHCVRCGTCDGFPCLVHAKSDADVLAVRPALEHPNVTLLTRARAVRLETNTTGTTVTGRRRRARRRAGDVHGRPRRRVRRRRQLGRAAAVFRQPRAPHGLANASGQVGRNYMFHNSQAVLALSKEPNPTVFQKTLGLNDFYFGSDDYEFPLGNIQMVGKSSADMYRGEKPLQTRLAPQWTLEQVARHAVDFWLSTEDLPRMENRVTLRRDGSIQLAYEPTNQIPEQRLLHELKHLLKHTRLHEHHLVPRHAYLKNEIPVAGVAHQAGTCRFGLSPATSVLDANCRAHDVDNLYVVDTSFFPSIGAVNPALTAMANALRVGDHLLDRLGAPERPRRRPHMSDELNVVVVGGGFAGVGCARRLARHDDVHVTLLDRNNYHQFQPLLYQVATSQLASSDIAFSLRKVFADDANVDVKLGTVESLDPVARSVTTTDGGRSPATRSCSRRARSRTSSAPRAPRSTRSRSTASMTRSGCGRASSACSRTPTVTRR